MNVEMPVRRDMHRRDRQHDIFHVEENNPKKKKKTSKFLFIWNFFPVMLLYKLSDNQQK